MPIAQISWMRADSSEALADVESPPGRRWGELLRLSKESPGFISQTWCRGYEDPSLVRLHIIRTTLEEHKVFADSEQGIRFHSLLQDLVKSDTAVEIQHVELEDILGNALTAPLTGTALYLSTNEIFTTLVWPLWTHIVRHKRGFRGITSGKVLDHKSGQEAYLVYAGWESLEAHMEYWEGSDIRNKDGILDMGNSGQVEFYHVVFEQG